MDVLSALCLAGDILHRGFPQPRAQTHVLASPELAESLALVPPEKPRDSYYTRCASK